jgi:hypothetical protein
VLRTISGPCSLSGVLSFVVLALIRGGQHHFSSP